MARHRSPGKGGRSSARRSETHETPWLLREYGGTPVWLIIVLVGAILAVMVFSAVYEP